MKRIRSISFVVIYTLLFTALIFTGKQIFFPIDISSEEKYLEASALENYTDFNNQGYYSFSGNIKEDATSALHELIYESFHKKYSQSQQDKVSFRYIPSLLENKIENSYLPLAELFFYKREILSHIEELGVFLYQNKKDTRGKMKSKNIHLF